MSEPNHKSKIKTSQISTVLQSILNVSLLLLAAVLCVLLGKEIFYFIKFLFKFGIEDNFFERILTFFLYFEFISMISKYFKEDYHFPLRYFLYIGITAMIRVIIVEHGVPFSTLLDSGVILVLIISNYIVNKTPRERP